MSDSTAQGKPLTDTQRALMAVIRQCTLVDDAKGDRREQIRRAEGLVELSRVVVRRIEEQP